MPSVNLNIGGPCWPLGFIKLVAPDTPVRFTSLVDPGNLNAPETQNLSGAKYEYTPRCQQIMLQGFKPGAGGHGFITNAGNIYVGLAGAGSLRDDPGRIVAIIAPQQTIFLASAPLVKDVFSPYIFYLDGDTADDGLLIAAFIF